MELKRNKVYKGPVGGFNTRANHMPLANSMTELTYEADQNEMDTARRVCR